MQSRYLKIAVLLLGGFALSGCAAAALGAGGAIAADQAAENDGGNLF